MKHLMRSSIVVLLIGASIVAARIADAAPPENAYFQRTWERTDKPVTDGAVSRTWMWGPEANTGLVLEDYADSPGGKRTVQYFDKSRMEITHPEGDSSTIWYVTNGLLSKELITGQMQTGDNSFISRSPAQINVAGDSDDPTGPTYATFSAMLDLPPLANGSTIIQRVNRAGQVTDDPTLGDLTVTAAYRLTAPGLDHQVASPFWTFMNSVGPVYETGALTTETLFPDPFYATGYPITEAYWATVRVAGTPRDVLVQCFERRCLTYTPGNPAGFATEAGNVGQHYYRWRYPDVATEYTFFEQIGGPIDASLELDAPFGIAVNRDGSVWVTDTTNHRVQVYSANGMFLRTVGGEGNGPGKFNLPAGIAVDADENIYIVDVLNSRVQKLDADGEYVTEWGSFGEGPGEFVLATFIAVNENGVYVVDSGNDRVQMFDHDGGFLAAFGRSGDGPGEFDQPRGIALDRAGNIYVADLQHDRVEVFDDTLLYRGQWGESGAEEGQMDGPLGLAIGDLYGEDIVYVTESQNRRVQAFSVEGESYRVWGLEGDGLDEFSPQGIATPSGSDFGSHPRYVTDAAGWVHAFSWAGTHLFSWHGAERGRFHNPNGIGLDPDGGVIVTDAGGSGGMTRFDASGALVAAWEASASAGVAVAPSSDVFAADVGAGKIQIFSDEGTFIDAWNGADAPGGPLEQPGDVAFDGGRNLYVADSGKDQIVVFDPDGEVLRVWGSPGQGPGQFDRPTGVAVHADRVYVVELDVARVQVFSLEGEFIRQWGENGDGPGEIGQASGIDVDDAGLIYVADMDNDRITKFGPSGEYIATIGVGGEGPGELDRPVDVEIGRDGAVYVVDAGNARIQVFTVSVP